MELLPFFQETFVTDKIIINGFHFTCPGENTEYHCQLHDKEKGEDICWLTIKFNDNGLTCKIDSQVSGIDQLKSASVICKKRKSIEEWLSRDESLRLRIVSGDFTFTYINKVELPNDELMAKFSVLTKTELKVISCRYGFFGSEKSIQEIAIKFGVTRERVRQIEAKALEKMRMVGKLPKL